MARTLALVFVVSAVVGCASRPSPQASLMTMQCSKGGPWIPASPAMPRGLLEVNEVAGHKCTPDELNLCNSWLAGRGPADTCQVTGIHVAPRPPTP